MNRAALMQRIEQHFGAQVVTRGADLAVLLEDICCQVYQWAREDERNAAASLQRCQVKTWQERMPKPKTAWRCVMNCSGAFGKVPEANCGDCEPFTVHGDPVAARDIEIAELRAALAIGDRIPNSAVNR